MNFNNNLLKFTKMNSNYKGNSAELFLPSLKSNIKNDPVFYNVRMFLI